MTDETTTEPEATQDASGTIISTDPAPEVVEPAPEPEPADYVGPDPTIDHPEPTEPPEEPVGYGLADVLVKIEDGTEHTLEDWQADDREALTVSCTNLDGSRVFDFDDRTHHPRDVVVYTNGRPPAE